MTGKDARRRVGVAAGLIVALTAALTLIPAGAAVAAPPAAASCVGHEASDISPPGSSGEFPGGMPELKAVLDAFFPGVPTGAIISTVARLHEGSHEACDEAVD